MIVFWSFIDIDVKMFRTALHSSHPRPGLCCVSSNLSDARLVRRARQPFPVHCCAGHIFLWWYGVDGTPLAALSFRKTLVGDVWDVLFFIFFLVETLGMLWQDVAQQFGATNNNAHNTSKDHFLFPTMTEGPMSLVLCG